MYEVRATNGDTEHGRLAACARTETHPDDPREPTMTAHRPHIAAGLVQTARRALRTLGFAALVIGPLSLLDATAAGSADPDPDPGAATETPETPEAPATAVQGGSDEGITITFDDEGGIIVFDEETTPGGRRPGPAREADRRRGDVERWTRRTTDTAEIVRIGTDVEVSRGDVVLGSVIVMDGDVFVDGTVEGNVVTIAGNIEVTGEVEGNLVAVLGGIELDALARCGADVVSIGGRIDDFGAQVDGDAVSLSFLGDTVSWSSITRFALRVVVFGFVFYLLMTLLVTAILGRQTQAALEEAVEHPGRSFGAGLLLGLGMLLASAVLSITLIGIPIAILVAGLFWAWAVIVGAARMGRALSPGRDAGAGRFALVGGLILYAAIIGGVLLAASESVPAGFRLLGIALHVLGRGAEIIVGLVGAGALARTRLGTRTDDEVDDVQAGGLVGPAPDVSRAT